MISFHHTPLPEPSNQSLFEPGQLVRHRRYGYRGVVVARDETCQADHGWYAKNQTQPSRRQPWYHVLVHESVACTYAAAENLLADDSGQPVIHPLMERFFDGFAEGRHLRNETAWPM